MILDFSDNQSCGGQDLAWGSHTKLQSTSAFFFFISFLFTYTALLRHSTLPMALPILPRYLEYSLRNGRDFLCVCILMCFSFLMQCDGVRYITFCTPADQRSCPPSPFPFQPHEISLSQKKKKMQRSPENPPSPPVLPLKCVCRCAWW